MSLLLGVTRWTTRRRRQRTRSCCCCGWRSIGAGYAGTGRRRRAHDGVSSRGDVGGDRHPGGEPRQGGLHRTPIPSLSSYLKHTSSSPPSSPSPDKGLSPCLSDLSTHPCFARNALCKELLQSATATLAAAHALAAKCSSADSLRSGKLQTQSDLDALSGELDLLLHDCALQVKTGAAAGGALKNLASVPEVRPSLCLLCCPHNKRELKRDERSIANLVRLLEPTPQNIGEALTSTRGWCRREW